MNTRRDIATALIGLPALATASSVKGMSGIEPFSEEAARIISYTLYAEARGEPFPGKMAVAAVIHTRAQKSKKAFWEICLESKQFTCWNEIDAVPDNYITGEGIVFADLKARSVCYNLAWILMSSSNKWDYLTHFYNPDKVTPSWATDLRGTRIIGRHVFGYLD